MGGTTGTKATRVIPATTTGTVARAMERVFRKIGILFERISDEIQDYLDMDALISSYPNWVRQFIRPFYAKINTPFENGDIIRDQVDYNYYLVTAKRQDYLLNEGMNIYGQLYACNVSGELQRPSGQRDTSSMEYDVNYPIVSGSIFGTLVSSALHLEKFGGGLNEEATMFFYTSQNYGVQVLDRFLCRTLNKNYKVEVVDNNNLPGCSILTVSDDTR